MRVTKLGADLVVRLPADVAERLDLKEGDEVEVSAVVQQTPVALIEAFKRLRKYRRPAARRFQIRSRRSQYAWLRRSSTATSCSI